MDEMFEVGDVRSTVTQVEGKVWERDDDYKIVWADGQVDVFEDRSSWPSSSTAPSSRPRR
jgi:hypothetical protein